MFKHSLQVLLALALALLLAGCAAKFTSSGTAPETTSPKATSPTESPLPAVTIPATEAPSVDIPQETPASESEIAPLHYPQYIDRCDQSVFGGPGYDYGFVDTVRVQGNHIIVEEAEDYEGNLWGRLESGVGWVDLTQIRSENYVSSLISANYADADLLASNVFFHFSTDSEYSIPIAFHAYSHLWDVALFPLDWRDDGLYPGSDLLTMAELTPEKPLVAELDFPGDMTTYGIRFTDEAGVSHVFYIYQSGRNGSLILSDN